MFCIGRIIFLNIFHLKVVGFHRSKRTCRRANKLERQQKKMEATQCLRTNTCGVYRWRRYWSAEKLEAYEAEISVLSNNSKRHLEQIQLAVCWILLFYCSKLTKFTFFFSRLHISIVQKLNFPDQFQLVCDMLSLRHGHASQRWSSLPTE